MDTPPSSRAEWAQLDWQEAQHQVARLLNSTGFMTFEEKSLANHKRTDLLAIRDTGSTVHIGILEVKCYQKVTRTLEKSAMQQALRYLKLQFLDSHGSQRWGNKDQQYFAGVIYTKDYPASFLHHTPEVYRKFLPSRLGTEVPLYLFSTTPNSLIQKLNSWLPLPSKQTRIDEFFE